MWDTLAADGREASVTPDDLQDEGFAFNVTLNQGKTSSGIVSLIVGRVGLHEVMIDSGATSNVISIPTWENLKRKGIKVLSQERTARQLFAYGSSSLLVTHGTFTAEVISPVNGTRCIAEFVVVEGNGRSLLGKLTAEKLDLLQVGPPATSK